MAVPSYLLVVRLGFMPGADIPQALVLTRGVYAAQISPRKQARKGDMGLRWSSTVWWLSKANLHLLFYLLIWMPQTLCGQRGFTCVREGFTIVPD